MEADSSPRGPAPWLDENPRALGEVITDAVGILRRDPATVFVFVLPFCAVELMTREGASALMSSVRRGASGAAGEGAFEALLGLLMPFSLGLGLFFASKLVVMTLAACTTVHARAVLSGERPSPAAIVAEGLRFAPRIIVAEIVFDLALVAAVILPWPVLIPLGYFGGPVGVILGLGAWVFYSTIITIVIYLRWVLFPQTIVLEGCGPLESLTRSAELMGPEGVKVFDGPKLRLSIVMLVYWVVASAVQALFLVPTGIAGYFEGIPLEEMPPPLIELSLFWAIPIALAQVAINAALFPIYAYLPTVFYADLQVRYGDLGIGGGSPDLDEADPLSLSPST